MHKKSLSLTEYKGATHLNAYSERKLSTSELTPSKCIILNCEDLVIIFENKTCQIVFNKTKFIDFIRSFACKSKNLVLEFNDESKIILFQPKTLDFGDKSIYDESSFSTKNNRKSNFFPITESYFEDGKIQDQSSLLTLKVIDPTDTSEKNITTPHQAKSKRSLKGQKAMKLMYSQNSNSVGNIFSLKNCKMSPKMIG